MSTTSASYDLSVAGTASGTYALQVMTVITVIFLPLVLLYQGWTYYVFRARVGTAGVEPAPTDDPVSTDY